MLRIGCHLSVSRGYAHMAKEALSIDANTFQFFSRNPRGSKVKKLDREDLRELAGQLKEKDFAPILAHAPYTMNPCSADPGLRQLAADMMQEDLARLDLIPGQYYTFHPGSHVGQGIEQGIEYIIAMLNQVLRPDLQTTVLLEAMSGKGSEVGSRFEQLRQIIEGTTLKEHLGICIDTCHLFAAGYDVRDHLDDVLSEFDAVLGLCHLRAIHLNDSMTPLGSRKDRHAKIGEGEIGREALVRVIRHPQLQSLPFYLETPNELDGYAAEIQFLREASKEG